MHYIAILRVSSQYVRDNFAKCLWKNPFVNILYGIVYIFFGCRNATLHISLVTHEYRFIGLQIYEQTSEKHQACLNVFYCECSLYSRFTAKIQIIKQMPIKMGPINYLYRVNPKQIRLFSEAVKKKIAGPRPKAKRQRRQQSFG